jgi:hypothetical protein
VSPEPPPPARSGHAISRVLSNWPVPSPTTYRERLLLELWVRRSESGSPASVRHTDACHSQGAQGTDREHPQAGSCQTAKDDGGKPGARFLARPKRGTRFRTASPLGGTRQRRRRFCSPWVGRDQGRRHCRWRSPDDRNWLSFRFSRNLDEGGPTPVANDRETPGKREPPCRLRAQDHRKCGRTGKDSQFRSLGKSHQSCRRFRCLLRSTLLKRFTSLSCSQEDRRLTSKCLIRVLIAFGKNAATERRESTGPLPELPRAKNYANFTRQSKIDGPPGSAWPSTGAGRRHFRKS